MLIKIDFCIVIDLDTMCAETDEESSLETNNMASMQTTKTEVGLA